MTADGTGATGTISMSRHDNVLQGFLDLSDWPDFDYAPDCWTASLLFSLLSKLLSGPSGYFFDFSKIILIKFFFCLNKPELLPVA